ALQCFESVEIVAVHTAIADANRFADSRPERHLDRRRAPGHRETGAGHESEAQSARSVVHLARPVPIPRQVLVVEDRHGAAARFEDLYDLLEDFVERILVLSFFVAFVPAMFAYEQHAIDGQLFSAERQGFADAGVELHRGEARGAVAA